MGITVQHQPSFGVVGEYATSAGYGQYLQKMREQQQQAKMHSDGLRAQAQQQANAQAFQAEQAQLAREYQNQKDIQDFEQQKAMFGLSSKQQSDMSTQGFNQQVTLQGMGAAYAEQAMLAKQKEDRERLQMELDAKENSARWKNAMQNPALAAKLGQINQQRIDISNRTDIYEPGAQKALAELDDQEQRLLKYGDQTKPPTFDEQWNAKVRTDADGTRRWLDKDGVPVVKDAPKSSHIGPDIMQKVFKDQLEAANMAALDAVAGKKGADGKPVQPAAVDMVKVRQAAMEQLRMIHSMMEEFGGLDRTKAGEDVDPMTAEAMSAAPPEQQPVPDSDARALEMLKAMDARMPPPGGQVAPTPQDVAEAGVFGAGGSPQEAIDRAEKKLGREGTPEEKWVWSGMTLARTMAEAKKLPPGTYFKDPQGNIRMVPR